MDVVDLFCGAGGMALGLSRAGMRIRVSYDTDVKALAVHKANLRSGSRFMGFGLPLRRLRGPLKSDIGDLLALTPDIAELAPDVIAGGPPCQPFSRAGKRKGDADPRAKLTEAFGVIVAAARPRYFIMENVPGIRRYNVYRRMVLMVRRAGYGLTEIKLDASFHGTGQARERWIVIGCLGEADDFLKDHLEAARSSKRTTVADVLGADLDVHGIGPDRLYFLTPGGSSTAGTRSIDQPAATFTHTSRHGPYRNYQPRKGDVPNVHDLPVLGFEILSRLGGFPRGWKWDVERPRSHADPEKPSRRPWITKGNRMQMLANSVPPPLAEAVGRCIMAHARGEVVDRPPEIPEGYEAWLTRSRKLRPEECSQVMTDLRAAMRLYLGCRRFRDADHAVAFLDQVPRFAALGATRKSNLRRGVRLVHEYQATLEKCRRLAEQRKREQAWAFDDENVSPPDMDWQEAKEEEFEG